MARDFFEFDPDGYLQGKIEWDAYGNGPVANSSNVTAVLYARRTNSATTKGRSWSGFVGINNDKEWISFNTSVSVSSDWVEMVRISRTIPHNPNGSGGATLSGSVSGPTQTTLEGRTSSGSSPVTFDTIPRYATGTSLTILKVDLNTVQIKWFTEQTCSAIKYGLALNNMQEVSVNANAGTFNFSQLDPDTSYTIYFNAKRKDSGLYLTDNITLKFKTQQIATITNAPDVNIGENQTLTISNPANATLSLELYENDEETLIEDFGSISGANVVVQPEASTLYNLTPYSNVYTAKYKLTCIQNGETYYSFKPAAFIVTEANPYFNGQYLPIGGVDYEDTNEATLALTGLNTRLIKGYSNAKFTIYKNLFVAVKGANLTENNANFTVLCGNKSQIVTYQDADYVTINNIETRDGSVTVKDSRGNTFTRDWITRVPTLDPSRSYSFYEYFAPRILEGDANRTGGVAEETILSFNGEWWNDSFGSASNALESVTYKYREVGTQNYSSEIAVTPTINGNTFSFSQSIVGDLGGSGFDQSKSYDIIIRVQDKLDFAEYQILLIAGTPALAIAHGNKVAQGKKYDESLGGDFQMNGTVYLNGESLMTQGDIENSLTSDDESKVLSAKQGKELKTMFDNYAPEIASAFINRKRYTKTQSWVSINLAPFDRVVKNTDRITVTSTGLKIGAGISKILISAHCQGIDHSSFPGDVTFTIIKNGTTAIRGAESYMTNQGSWCAHDITPLLIDCNESDIKENDVLSIYMGGGGTGTGELLGEYFTIQIIE